MTPKEKAITLVNELGKYTMFNYDNAKQCALIAVDEILKSLDGIDSVDDEPYSAMKIINVIEFYLKVKTEIEKL